jgi:hypothetical protein
MRNIIFIATACVLLSACGAYQPFRTQGASHGYPVSPGNEVKGKTVRNTVAHRGLTNARAGAAASKLTPKNHGKTVRSNTVAHRGLTNARAEAAASKLIPKNHGKTVQEAPAAQGGTFRGIQAAQEAFRGLPIPAGDEAGATGSKLTPIQAAQEAFRGLPIPQGDEENGTTLPSNDNTSGGGSVPVASSR